MIRRSVTVRLVLTVMALESLLIACLAATVYVTSNDYFHTEFDGTLAARAEAIASLVEADAAGRPAMETPPLPISRRSPHSQHPDLYRVWTDEGRVLSESGELAAGTPTPWIQGVAQPNPGERQIFDSRWRGENYRGIWIRVPVPLSDSLSGEAPHAPTYCNIVLAISARKLHDQSEDMVDRLLIVSAVMLTLSAAFTALLVKWALRPIRRAARELESIDLANLDARPVGSQDAPREIGPFVRTLNEMLSRLAGAFRRQRNFIANASHELRTPMAVIKSTVQGALRRARSSEDYRATLDEVLEDLSRIEHLVDQLLLLARLDEGAVETTPVGSFSLWTLLSEVLVRYQGEAADAGVRLNWPQLPEVKMIGHADLADRLFDNLVSNAIRYNREGGEVTVRQWQADGQARVEVFNTGPRIPQADLTRVFDRFFRVEGSRSRDARHAATTGTGLGLSIAREIVQRHGGRIEALNVEGGVVFAVSLPLAPPERTADGRGQDRRDKG
ncbi:MAG: Sensor kinase CusS [Phycisphaerae bacterium]|nr:Sensor kinase CusS [Phycisphaerae bacterium]